VDENIFEIALAGSGPERVEGIARVDFAAVNDGDAVAEFLGLAHDMGREDDGFALGTKFRDDLLHFEGGEDIQADGGFIEDEDGRVMDDGAGDGDFLFHALGKLVDACIGIAADPKPFDEGLDAAGDIGIGPAIDASKEIKRFARSEARIKGSGSGAEPEVFADLFGFEEDVVTHQFGGAGGWLEDGGEHPERGGFSSAVRPQQAKDFPGAAIKGDLVHGADFTAAFVVEGFGEVFDQDGRETAVALSGWLGCDLELGTAG